MDQVFLHERYDKVVVTLKFGKQWNYSLGTSL